ncbi:delta-6-fatty acid desaturase [Cokeromyces recurvatus]|uniref:delta-6-fatty acid desaturase n=1 Tax=Cokeromyces recurvatus TaxID=90255 RepID=UPI002220A698|nr:delta-6-fatty acid desaturase [Cokeromyces recurvatus]KAI7902692.1 delta-6-fatty acid desaturase [Cokeromyces recurvatus]
MTFSREPQQFTRKQLEKMNQAVKDGDKDARKCIIIDNKLYDVTEFIEDHPGGEAVLMTHIGKDASDVFHAMHPDTAYEILANYYAGDLLPEEVEDDRKLNIDENNNSIKFAAEMRELRDKLKNEGYFHASKLFYVYKVLSTLAICGVGLGLLYAYGRTSTLAVVASGFIIGIFWQQCGWLAHDFGHHQCFEDRSMNDILLVFLGNFCQGFSLSWWKNKHNTHHASTNVHGQDPDIDTAPVLLWDEYASAAYYGSLDEEPNMISRFLAQSVLPYQTRYYFFVLGFARISWALQSLLYSFNQGAINKSAQMNLYERGCLICHWILFTYCTIAWNSSLYNMVLFFLISQATTGYTLALVFALNHNGMPIITEEKAEKMEFFEIQVVTGRDVSMSPLGDWFMGGLNYQIEHHVFPNMPRHNLPKVKPMVKSLCQQYNIHYHDTSFFKGTLEVLKALDVTSNLSLQLSKKAF